jgi:hypothetical protein
VDFLTNSQSEVPKWMIESDSDTLVLVETWGSDAFLKGTEGGQRPVSAAGELVAQGVIRSAGGKSYEVTHEGWRTYQQAKNPPRLGRARAGSPNTPGPTLEARWPVAHLTGPPTRRASGHYVGTGPTRHLVVPEGNESPLCPDSPDYDVPRL